MTAVDGGSVDEVRAAVAAAGRRLAALGLVEGTSGNVSARHGDHVAVTPTGGLLEALEPGDVTIVDLDGRVVDGHLAPTSELGLHLAVLRHHADAGAVVHAHCPIATALSCVLDELPCVHYEMLRLGGSVPVARYETFGTPALAEAVADALGERHAALMANHGTAVRAHDVDSAVELTRLLEWACGVYWRATAIGTPRTLDGDAQQAVVAAALARDYGTTKPVDEEER